MEEEINVTPDMVYDAVMLGAEDDVFGDSIHGILEAFDWWGFDSLERWGVWYLQVLNHVIEYAKLGIWKVDSEFRVSPFLNATSKIGIPCKRCGSYSLVKNGHTRDGKQLYLCENCGFQPSSLTNAERQRYPEVMRDWAIDYLREGHSSRMVADMLEWDFGFSPNISVICEWAREKGVKLPPRREIEMEGHKEYIRRARELHRLNKSIKTWTWNAAQRFAKQEREIFPTTNQEDDLE